MALGGFVLGSLILYLKGMRRMMFQLSGFYYKAPILLIVPNPYTTLSLILETPRPEPVKRPGGL